MTFSNNKELTQGALLCALSVIIFSCFPIPFIGNLLSAFSAVPFILLAYKFGIKFTLISILASSLLISQIFGPAGAILFICFFALTGGILGTIIKRTDNPGPTIFIASLCSVFFFGVFSEVISNISDVRFPVQELNTTFEAQIEAGKAQSLAKIKNEEDKKRLNEIYSDFLNNLSLMLKNFYPSLLMLAGVITTVINYALSIFFFYRLYGIRLASFNRYRLSWHYGIPIIFALIIYELCVINFDASLSTYPAGLYGTLYFIAINIIASGSIFFIFQGIAVTDYFLSSKNVISFFRIMIYLCSFMIPPAMAFLLILGIFDPWFDFRKLDKQEEI